MLNTYTRQHIKHIIKQNKMVKKIIIILRFTFLTQQNGSFLHIYNKE